VIPAMLGVPSISKWVCLADMARWLVGNRFPPFNGECLSSSPSQMLLLLIAGEGECLQG
jgi:hypothetical protein